MEKTLFYRLGRTIYRLRLAVILLWVLGVAVCIPFLPHIMAPFKSTGFVASKAESTLAEAELDKQLGYDQNNRFLVVYYSPHLHATGKTFNKKIKRSLADLKKFPLAHDIIYPKDNPQQISKNKHSAYVMILIKSNESLTPELLKQFKHSIKTPKNMRMQIGGRQIFTQGINKQTQEDLYKADAIAAPLTSIVLLLIFGTLIAMLIPVCLGGGCALIILTALYFIGHVFTLSIFTLNLALLLGLCLSLDYALFIIFRFRGELRTHKNIENAIAITLSTAGRAIFFSGVAVFISLSALLLFPINILFSIGVGGLVAVFFAVMIAITLLPAVLSVLGHRINALAVRKINKKDTDKKHLWRALATTVVKRPFLFLFLSLGFLLLLAYPLLNVKFGISDFKIVPKHSESRLFFDEFKQHFNENELAPILLVVSTERHSILASHRISKLYRFTRKLEKIKGIERVDSIVTTNPRLSRKQYQRLYQSSAVRTDAGIKQLLSTTTGKRFTLIRVFSEYEANSDKTRALIKQIKGMSPGKGLTLKVTGVPVKNFDVMQVVSDIFPYAVAWVMALTYLSLLILLRSLFLPLKAIFMNVLSLSACYGVLVFIFQDGNFHQLLNFEPQGMLDITLVIIIFCAIFGFSMDYEVFLLTRIQEHYQKTHQNKASIIFGIEKSSRIITSAALIVICICGSFMAADVLMVKEFGLGIAVAIAVDAFVIRSILVPSTMVLLKNWNWYIPKWLAKLLP
ncbi:MAG: MMPL family transporter [Gammaproteobacteria bacterium]|nr:MMPL family transporter [Gammaproteobacteria bacterium]MCH9763548.1 MMPL family transporter [Gammaproteobacteria bacterium]